MTTTLPGTSADEFPVEFADPADAELSWWRDRLHTPDQVTPLAFDVIARCFGTGAPQGFRAYYAPITGWGSLRVNTYTYSYVATATGTPEEMAAMGAKAEAATTEGMARIKTLWEDELLPEIHGYLKAWEDFDLPGVSMDALLAHLDDTLAWFTRLCDIHFVAITPAYLAVSELDETYRSMFEGRGAFEGYKLVQGHLNKTVEVGHELWRLSRTALAAPEVAAAILTKERRSAAEIVADLSTTGAGKEFLAALDTYLEVYGQRGDLFFDLDRPSWLEDPTPAFDALRSYMSQSDGADPALVVEALATEREAVIAEARAGMTGYPAPVRQQFEFLLEAATTGVVITEDHGFWIDFRSSYKVRQVLLEFGRRLAAANEIAVPDDVFLLTVDEMRESAVAAALGAPCRTGGEPSRGRLVAHRRAEMERFAAVRPPDVIGAPAGPVDLGDNPFARFMTKFFGGPVAYGADDDPGVVRGNPGGPGRVKGIARVIRSIAEADRLAPGEILVAETTTPPWTPLFAIAAAVVTDTGGVLSHCAVVAREYGLPAVVGTGRGTDRIKDGMVIEVDGDNGTVFLMEESVAP